MEDDVTPAMTLKSGLTMPGLGFGTWRLGEDASSEDSEIAAIRRALDLGFIHFDTADMYGEGATERLLGAALAGRDRRELFLTSKVYPWNAGARDMVRACEASLDRLGTDYLDLYLLHWPGGVPFEETLEGAAALRSSGKIRAFGVSNFDARSLSDLVRTGLDGPIEVNQVMYNPSRRGIEFDLLPLMQRHRIACVAYTPIEPRRVVQQAGFRELAVALGLHPVQLALAWHMTRGHAVPIPKASTTAHVDALWAAAETRLDTASMEEIDRIFPPPSSPQSLDII